MEWLKDIKLLVLDLDGTLYQDEQFVQTYVTSLFGSDAEGEVVNQWNQVAVQILQDQHPLKLGHFYHKTLNCGVLHREGQAVGLYDWMGQRVYHPNEVTLEDSAELHYIGDAWGVVGAIAGQARIPEERRGEAFMAVRKQMIEGSHPIQGHAGVNTVLRDMKHVPHKLLISNSSQEAAVDFVTRLELGALFDEIILGGDKPYGLARVVEAYMEKHAIRPEQVLSIGDNAWNDLYPVRKLGGRTVWISPYESHDEQQWDVRLRTLDELEQLLRKVGA